VEGEGATVDSLGAGGLEVLLLANVGHEGNDVVALLDEPTEDARGVFRKESVDVYVCLFFFFLLSSMTPLPFCISFGGEKNWASAESKKLTKTTRVGEEDLALLLSLSRHAG
jgi:hypothetical protein